MLMGVSENKVAVNTRNVLEKGLTMIGCSRSGRADFERAVGLMLDATFHNRLSAIIYEDLPVSGIADIGRVMATDLTTRSKPCSAGTFKQFRRPVFPPPARTASASSVRVPCPPGGASAEDGFCHGAAPGVVLSNLERLDTLHDLFFRRISVRLNQLCSKERMDQIHLGYIISFVVFVTLHKLIPYCVYVPKWWIPFYTARSRSAALCWSHMTS